MGIALVVIGVACIVYGVLVMLAGSGTWFFAFWYFLGAVVLLAAWIVVSGRWDALSALVRHVFIGAFAVFLVVFAFTQVLILREFADEGESGLDYIVVLGAQVYQRGPSVALRYRLDAAYDYLLANDGAKCIVSGGRGPNEHTAEANVMADYLIERGVDPARILREGASGSTVQNIAYSMELFDPASDRVGIVTNGFHLFRALALARKAGIADVSGIAAGSAPLYLPNNMVRESLGLAKDFVAGNL